MHPIKDIAYITKLLKDYPDLKIGLKFEDIEKLDEKTMKLLIDDIESVLGISK